MHARAIAILVSILIIGLALPCFAGRAGDTFMTQNEQIKLALHLDTHLSRSCTKNMPSLSTRGDLVRQWAGYEDLDVFFVMFQYDEIRGVQYGLNWPGDWGSAVTTQCADLKIGDIVNPGDGFALAWSTCELPASAGGTRPAFWPVAWSWIAPSSDGEIEIIETPSTGKVSVSNCINLEMGPDSVFFAGVNVDPYEGPFVGIEPTTWGGIKAMFR